MEKHPTKEYVFSNSGLYSHCNGEWSQQHQGERLELHGHGAETSATGATPKPSQSPGASGAFLMFLDRGFRFRG